MASAQKWKTKLSDKELEDIINNMSESEDGLDITDAEDNDEEYTPCIESDTDEEADVLQLQPQLAVFVEPHNVNEMALYTTTELTDMVLVYREKGENVAETQRFRHRQHPSCTLILSTVQNLRDRGITRPNYEGRGRERRRSSKYCGRQS
ncbi:hypothetical protein QE152_g39856 [Popillia japonica]|uniref:Uncharacterized protein n=1 Tax=Popillia japonica TaxID=7064 RepID=A0AAW1HTI7_POPJA